MKDRNPSKGFRSLPRLFFLAFVALRALGFCAQVSAQVPPATAATPATADVAAAPDNRVRILIVGDSTVREYLPPRPDRGWGQYIEDYFKEGTVKVFNRAQAGRSTKTFIPEGRWKKGLAEKPSYVLIQFGHNDAQTTPGSPVMSIRSSKAFCGCV